MNNQRRSLLSLCASNLTTVRYSIERVKDSINTLISLKDELDFWSNQVNSVSSSMESIERAEQDALESIPNNFQFGTIANKIDDALFSLGFAVKSVDSLKGIIDGVEDSYIKSFLSSFSPEELQDKLDELIEAIDDAKNNIEEAKA